MEALLLEYGEDDDSDEEQDRERLERFLAYDSYPMEFEEPLEKLPSEKKAQNILEKTLQQYEERELEELERLLANELNELKVFLPNELDENFDSEIY